MRIRINLCCCLIFAIVNYFHFFGRNVHRVIETLGCLHVVAECIDEVLSFAQKVDVDHHDLEGTAVEAVLHLHHVGVAYGFESLTEFVGQNAEALVVGIIATLNHLVGLGKELGYLTAEGSKLLDHRTGCRVEAIVDMIFNGLEHAAEAMEILTTAVDIEVEPNACVGLIALVDKFAILLQFAAAFAVEVATGT